MDDRNIIAFCKLENIKSALKKLIAKNTRLSKTYTNAQLQKEWSEIVGSYISERTSKVYIYKEKLFIKIPNSVIKNEIKLTSDNILNKVNNRFDISVSDIVLL